MDIVCFSHLRWGFVYQRPNHLMARAARRHHVHFIEEPEVTGRHPRLRISRREGLTVVTPQLPARLGEQQGELIRRDALSGYLDARRLDDPWLWYYTPMALRWTRPLPAKATVYDCMDELSGFRGAPLELRKLERELLRRADVVFTGGRSLWDAKRGLHPRTYLFPSSVDVAHFAQARRHQPDPADQARIVRPRVGYFGVIDERLDLELLAHVAAARPDWQLVMIGPVVKVDEGDLPRAPNIHWLGLKQYAELPAYLAGWDVAMLPFALNEATRFISPTKTPEYLAGGRPVVSTPVRDVVRPYADAGLVEIAADGPAFVAAVERALGCERADLVRRADQMLASQSWDQTWHEMEQLVLGQHRRAVERRAPDLATELPATDLSGLAVGGAMAAPSVTRARSR